MRPLARSRRHVEGEKAEEAGNEELGTRRMANGESNVGDAARRER